MRSALIIIAALLGGCSSVASETPAGDTGNAGDAGGDVVMIIDSAPPSDDAWMLDAKCPEHRPAGPCTGTRTCIYPETLCGGDETLKCVDGTWITTSMSKCGPVCPQSRPEPGSACSGHPSGLVCSFWPENTGACESCTCTAGTWTCGTSCTMERSACRTGTACGPNTGCGAGRCSNYCGCSTDGLLHCTSTLC